MLHLKKNQKKNTSHTYKKKRLGLRPTSQIKKGNYEIVIITEKGERLTYRICRKRGGYKIVRTNNVPYTRIKLINNLKINSSILLYNQNKVIKGIVKSINALDPSTDVEPGEIPPTKRPGGH